MNTIGIRVELAIYLHDWLNSTEKRFMHKIRRWSAIYKDERTKQIDGKWLYYDQCRFLSFGQPKNKEKPTLEGFKEGCGSIYHPKYASTVMAVLTNKYITYQTLAEFSLLICHFFTRVECCCCWTRSMYLPGTARDVTEIYECTASSVSVSSPLATIFETFHGHTVKKISPIQANKTSWNAVT